MPDFFKRSGMLDHASSAIVCKLFTKDDPSGCSDGVLVASGLTVG
jgi:hypothetical protein